MANGSKNTKVAGDKSDIVRAIPMACADEDAAVEFFEAMRWGSEPACPRCGDMDVYRMQDRQGNRNARYLWRCRGCARQFTVRIGTVLEDSPISLRHWAYAFWAACSSKKGVSALQIKRQTGLSYKSALFLMHRIRWAMTNSGNGRKLMGTVEADETYVGGKPRYKGGKNKRYGGFGTKKAPVMAMVERDGEVRAEHMTKINKANLHRAISEHVDRSARLITDEHPAYKFAGPQMEGGHETVTHSAREYVRGDVHTNTVESFFALLKRGVYGIWHNVSPKHLHRYVAAAEFRYNTRHVDDGERVRRAIQGADGKRLTYRPVTG